MEELALEPWADLHADLDGLHLVAGSVGAGGELTALAVAPDLVQVVAPELDGPAQGSGQPRGPEASPYNGLAPYQALIVTVFPDGRRDRIEVDGCTAYEPEVERLADGGVLIVGSSCTLRRKVARPLEGGAAFVPYDDLYEAELNALRYDARGVLRGRSCLGTCISHVQVSPAGHVWVGYNDMGIYGNTGWGETGGPPPIGQAGLLRFDMDWAIRWRYEEPPGTPATLGFMADCESLTLAGDEGETAFACFYSDFPVARCPQEGHARLWATGGAVSGATALAVAGDTVAVVFDGYRGPQRVLTGRIDERDLELRDERIHPITLSGAKKPLARSRVRGRGPRLAALIDGVWHGQEVTQPAG